MSDQPRDRSPYHLIALGIVCTLLLYPLSLGPVVGLIESFDLPINHWTARTAIAIYGPVVFAAQKTGLDGLLLRYLSLFVRSEPRPPSPAVI